MIHQAVSNFEKDLRAVVNAWRDKPMDDQLTWVEIFGALDFLKLELMQEAQRTIAEIGGSLL